MTTQRKNNPEEATESPGADKGTIQRERGAHAPGSAWLAVFPSAMQERRSKGRALWGRVPGRSARRRSGTREGACAAPEKERHRSEVFEALKRALRSRLKEALGRRRRAASQRRTVNNGFGSLSWFRMLASCSEVKSLAGT